MLHSTSTSADSGAGALAPVPGFELAHAGTLQQFAELVSELGGDADALMRAVGIDPAALEACAPRLNYRAMIALLERAAQHLQRPDFGLCLAARQGGGRVFGPIGVVMRNAASLGDALRYVMTHMQAYCPATSMRIEPDGRRGLVRVCFDVLLADIPDYSQQLEQIMLLGQLNALQMTQQHVRAREVHFRHHAVSAPAVYRRYFGCPVHFDQDSDCIVFARADLEAPVGRCEDGQLSIARFFIDESFPAGATPLPARVRASIMHRLGSADCSIERAAQDLCLHPRTLHRRLKREATSFEDIKDEVRRDGARYYLEHTQVSLAEIAERLGYAQPCVLTRSCRRWFGSSPRQLRARGPIAAESPPAAVALAPAPADAAAHAGIVPASAEAATVRVEALAAFPDLVRRLGGDPGALMRRVGLDAEVLAQPDALIPHLTLIGLLEQAAAALHCPDFGLRLAAAQDLAALLGPLHIAMRSCATLRAALDYCAANMQASSAAAQIGLEQDGHGPALLHLRIRLPGPLAHAQAVEHMLLLTQRNLLQLSGGRIRAREVRLAHAPVSAPQDYERHFGCRVAFGRERCGLVLDPADLARPLPQADTQLFELARHFIQSHYPAGEQDLGARVRVLMRRQLPLGRCTREHVAAALGLNPRLLQRRLKADGHSFEALRDAVRRDLALHHLTRSDLPMTRLAQQLGYADAAALTRSCRRWFAAPPRRIRQQADAFVHQAQDCR